MEKIEIIARLIFILWEARSSAVFCGWKLPWGNNSFHLIVYVKGTQEYLNVCLLIK